jgi:predicted Fe-S protein YdhL (DUF1289 family)
MEVLEDSPCNGICRMEKVNGQYRCESCYRDYDDLAQWLYMTKEDRLERMEQLKQVMTHNGVTNGNKKKLKTNTKN